MFEPEKTIENNYDIKISSYIPYREGLLITDIDKKKYFLKIVNLSDERLFFMYGLKKYLYENGFTNTDRIMMTSDKNICIKDDNSKYILTDFIIGRECDFFDQGDIIKATRLLAEFHKAAAGYSNSENTYIQSFLGLTPKWYTKKIKEFNRIKNRASYRKTKFDSLLMEHIDYFIDRSSTTLAALRSSKYSDMVKKANSDLPICHNDFSYYNILCNNNEFYLINFDSCRYELKIFDIADFITRRMRKCNWEITETSLILDEYDKIYSIGNDELELMKIIINFPEKLCKTINRYYNSKKSKAKSGYLTKLQELIDETEPYEEYYRKLQNL